MNIALIGATGYVGSAILAEALARGHAVTAIVRNPSKLPRHERVKGVEANVNDTAGLAQLVAGHDVLISAFNPVRDADGAASRSIIAAAQRSGIPRLLVVGGAGTLLLPSGERVVDQPDFPAEWKEGALRTAAFLDLLQAEAGLDWVFLSPAALLAPGERTGRYRIGQDRLLVDADGASRISLPDYALALLDEAERPQHHRMRFTVAY
ncbi:MAG: NAD(P)-dependent oxidoreductase [Gammaproteobacteria bacterium]